jgi:hypothetical protein
MTSIQALIAGAWMYPGKKRAIVTNHGYVAISAIE